MSGSRTEAPDLRIRAAGSCSWVRPVGVENTVTSRDLHVLVHERRRVWVPGTVPRPLTRGIAVSGPTLRSPSAARLDRRGTRSRRSNPRRFPSTRGTTGTSTTPPASSYTLALFDLPNPAPIGRATTSPLGPSRARPRRGCAWLRAPRRARQRRSVGPPRVVRHESVGLGPVGGPGGGCVGSSTRGAPAWNAGSRVQRNGHRPARVRVGP